MYRDFSEKSKNELLGLVSEVENDKLSNFTDWIGDRWYDFESWIGKLNIRNYLNNVNEYHKKVIDKNNATKSSINVIFNNVKSVDTSYRETFTGKKSQLQQWQRYIDELNQIVNPRNGKFNPKAMSDALDGLLNQVSIDEVNANLKKYVDINKNTGEYTYNWNEIERLISSPKEELSQLDYLTLVSILSSMMDNKGSLDIENLQHLVNLGYSTPSQVTKYDVHVSFDHSELAGHHNYMNYYYLQNKSYLSDSLITAMALYGKMYEQSMIESCSSNLNDFLSCILENYTVIEWRERLRLEDYKSEFWSGDYYVKEDKLIEFNNLCTPKLTIEHCNDEDDNTGLKYYLIYTNAYDNGVETADIMPNGSIMKNGIEHKDPTIRIYTNCNKYEGSDICMMRLKSNSELSTFYKDYDIESAIAENIVEFVVGLLPAGDFLNGAIGMGKSADAIEQINEEIKLVKKVQLDEISNIPKRGEKVIDGGLEIVDKGVGIYQDYKATELNNKKVDVCRDAINDFSNDLSNLQNLGIKYETSIVEYNEYKYDENYENYINGKKNANKITSINLTNYVNNEGLLFDQYTTMTDKPDNYSKTDPEFIKLQEEIDQYISTGKVEEGSYLSKYIESW